VSQKTTLVVVFIARYSPTLKRMVVARFFCVLFIGPSTILPVVLGLCLPCRAFGFSAPRPVTLTEIKWK